MDDAPTRPGLRELLAAEATASVRCRTSRSVGGGPPTGCVTSSECISRRSRTPHPCWTSGPGTFTIGTSFWQQGTRARIIPRTLGESSSTLTAVSTRFRGNTTPCSASTYLNTCRWRMGFSLLGRLVALLNPGRVVNSPNAERPMRSVPAWMGHDTPARVQPLGPLGVHADSRSGRDRIPGLVQLPQISPIGWLQLPRAGSSSPGCWGAITRTTSHWSRKPCGGAESNGGVE